MFPGENEKLITTSILAFILGVVVAALTASYSDVGFGGILSALVTLVAAFSGAWFAFYLNTKKKAEREPEKDACVELSNFHAHATTKCSGEYVELLPSPSHQ